MRDTDNREIEERETIEPIGAPILDVVLELSLCYLLPIAVAGYAVRIAARAFGFPVFDAEAPLTEEAPRVAALWAIGCAVAIPLAIHGREVVHR